MLCRNCGKEFNGNFCPQCGSASEETSVNINIINDNTQIHNPDCDVSETKVESVPQESSSSKKKYLWIIVGVVAVLAVLLIGFFVWRGCSKAEETPEPVVLTEEERHIYCPDKTKHKFTSVTTEPLCTQRGYTVNTCSKCGYEYLSDKKDALGHKWGEADVIKDVSCTEDGKQRMTCELCSEIIEQDIYHEGHKYEISFVEELSDSDDTVYICTVCNHKVILGPDQLWPTQLKETVFVPDCDPDFSFLVDCSEGESYISSSLKVSGADGNVAYTVTEDADYYRISPKEPYREYQEYSVTLPEDITLPEYNAKSMTFTIVGPDKTNVEFNNDNIVYLKELEMQHCSSTGNYTLEWDEVAELYYLTLPKSGIITEDMIGKIVAVGDYSNSDEILQDASGELCFGRLKRITYNDTGKPVLELETPELSEVFTQYDIYFSGAAIDVDSEVVARELEQDFMNAVIESDGFAQYTASVHLAADSYAQELGLVAVHPVNTIGDSIKFELTKHTFEKIPNAPAGMLELEGKVSYTVPLKDSSDKNRGSVVMECKAGIKAVISAGGQFSKDKKINIYVRNDTTTTIGFSVKCNLSYSYEYEESYFLHKKTNKIHTSTCRIAKDETNRSNLESLSIQELTDRFNGDKSLMVKNECKVCRSMTGLDATGYVLNNSTGVLHCMNCRHVGSMSGCNIYTIYPDNTISYETCKDCRPEDRQTQDFNERMLNAIKGSNWAEQVNSIKDSMKDSMGKKSPGMSTDPKLTVPINVASVFNIEVGVTPVFSFDMNATADFSFASFTSNTYGIRSTNDKKFETYSYENPGNNDCKLSIIGEADATFGIALIAKAYPVGCEEGINVRINGQVGIYGHFSGVFSASKSTNTDLNSYAAARFETGLYAKIDGSWKVLWFDDDFNILSEQRIPLLKWGYDRVYFAPEKNVYKIEDKDQVQSTYQLAVNAKYMDLVTLKEGLDKLSLTGDSFFNVDVEIKNEDGSDCDYLEYNSRSGNILKKENAPDVFTAKVYVTVEPKVKITNISEFLASESKSKVYGSVLDPIEITLQVGDPDKEDEKAGTLSGKVCKASDRLTAVSNASIKVYKGSKLHKSATSNSTGNYSIDLSAGNYLVEITAPGYIKFRAYATVREKENTYMETFLLVEGSESEKGIAEGTVINSLTGVGAPDVNLTIKRDWNNTSESAETVKTLVTDSNGNYSVELPFGNYTVIATKDGCTDSFFNIVVQRSKTSNQNGTITPIVSGDDFLITLEWADYPRDLDSHMVGQTSNGDLFHVYFASKNKSESLGTVCSLDYDDTNGEGPEHITLSNAMDTPYYYFVHKYSSGGILADSEAKVKVEQGNVLIAEFNVPTDLGEGDYWNVFTIKDGELIINNTITDFPDIEYAN